MEWSAFRVVSRERIGLVVAFTSPGEVGEVLLGTALSLHGLVLGFRNFPFIVGIWTTNFVAHHNENLFLINPFTFGFAIAGPLLAFGRPSARPLLKTDRHTRRHWNAGRGGQNTSMFNQQNWNPSSATACRLFLISAYAFWRNPTAN